MKTLRRLDQDIGAHLYFVNLIMHGLSVLFFLYKEPYIHSNKCGRKIISFHKFFFKRGENLI